MRDIHLSASRVALLAGIAATFVVAAVALGMLLRGEADDAAAPLDPRLLEIAAQEMSDYQRGLLADGELTEGEYEAAFTAFRECAEASGAQFIEGTTEPDADGVYRAGVTVAPATQGVNRFAWQAVFECRRDHFQVVQQWRVVERSEGGRLHISFHAAISGCMQRSGHEFDGDLVALMERLLDPQRDDHSAEAAGLAPLNFAMLFCSLDLAVLFDQPPGAISFPQRGG
jgi:hypothetical protein